MAKTTAPAAQAAEQAAATSPAETPATEAAAHDPHAMVAPESAPLPQRGGSFVRQADGSIAPAA